MANYYAEPSDIAAEGYYRNMAAHDQRNELARRRKQEEAQRIAQDAVDMMAGGEADETIGAYMQAESARVGLPYSPQVLSMVKGRYNQLRGGDETAFGNPIYMRDEQGNTIAGQLTNRGRMNVPQVPEGYSIIDPVKFMNTGGQVQAFNPRDPQSVQTVATVTPKPTETPEYQAEVTTAKETAKNIEKKRAGYPKVRDAVAQTEQNAQTVDRVIDQAGQIIKQGRAAGWWAAAGGLPATQARTLQALFQQIKSNIGFNYLAEMRANSPTGGAVGSLTEREFDLLASTAGTLDPYVDPEILLQILNDMKNNQQRTIKRMKSAYETDYSDYIQQEAPQVIEGF